MSRADDPVFLVCRGKSCRKRKKKHAAVLETLANASRVRQVDCRDICEGPVVGHAVGKKTSWFRRVDTEKARDALLTLAARGEMRKTLRKRRVG